MKYPDNIEAFEGLDTLSNLAILGEGETLPAYEQATTKHPRHKPGCSCVVCIQPPNGKGSKHKQTCTCNVFFTNREGIDGNPNRNREGSDGNPNWKREGSDGSNDDPNQIKSTALSFKGQIDLNIPPEREEELSPCSNFGGMMKVLHGATERYLRQQSMSNSGAANSSSSQSQQVGDGIREVKHSNGVTLGNNNHNADME
ncbi:unnamed protein product [Lupinus luteus]|uniref:Uncharacterized protein n=1 Tax=Lupinus luteus TaxID=3873 RepID=A0AAV1WX17_LUPLU